MPDLLALCKATGGCEDECEAWKNTHTCACNKLICFLVVGMYAMHISCYLVCANFLYGFFGSSHLPTAIRSVSAKVCKLAPKIWGVQEGVCS